MEMDFKHMKKALKTSPNNGRSFIFEGSLEGVCWCLRKTIYMSKLEKVRLLKTRKKPCSIVLIESVMSLLYQRQ